MNIQKTTKLFYYLKGILRPYLPAVSSEKLIAKLTKKITATQIQEVQQRVDYYCSDFERNQQLPPQHSIRDLKQPKSPKAYYFDTYEHLKHFPENQKIDFVYGDVTQTPKTPSIVKSRPVENNANAVLLNLDKARHFVFVKNDKSFLAKKDLMIGRGAVYQQHRIDFFEKYFHHPLCDLGQVNKDNGKPEMWWKPKISIRKHLDYKFILSLQGNDVATNLKWIMSSNSIAVMPKPTLETWFMEGTLIGGKHFIEIQPDYADLENQLSYYIAHPEECLQIIENAHKHCEQFFNPNIEKLTSLLVMKKYLNKLNEQSLKAGSKFSI